MKYVVDHSTGITHFAPVQLLNGFSLTQCFMTFYTESRWDSVVNAFKADWAPGPITCLKCVYGQERKV